MTSVINSNEQMIEKINEVLQNKKNAVVNIVNDKLTISVFSLLERNLHNVKEINFVIRDVKFLPHQTKIAHEFEIKRNRLLEYMQIKNKTNKINLYKKWYYRTYMIMNESAYSNTELILDGNGWYDSEHMELLYTYYKKLVDTRDMLKKAITGVEK